MTIAIHFQRTFALIALLSLSLSGFAQTLRGTVKGDNGELLTRATVFILGVDEVQTNSNGAFSISLANCQFCQVGTTLTVYVNSDYGAVQHPFTIPQNLANAPCNIIVPQNNRIIITGKVKDKKTQRFISGIIVRAVINGVNIQIPAVKTDAQGVFQIVLSRSGIGLNQAIELLFQDDTNKYKEKEAIVFTNQRAPLTIELEECTDCGTKHEIKVGDRLQSPIPVSAGDHVTIEASGIMRFGKWIGTAGPGGFPNNRGVGGISLAGYNIFPDWNHGCLLFRFGRDDQWKHYDDSRKNSYYVQTTGYIEFDVNDNNKDDNSGAFDVIITIRQ